MQHDQPRTMDQERFLRFVRELRANNGDWDATVRADWIEPWERKFLNELATEVLVDGFKRYVAGSRQAEQRMDRRGNDWPPQAA